MITTLTEDTIGVTVPEDAHSFEVYANNVVGGWCVMYLRGNPDYACSYSPNLPEGNWDIIGKASGLEEIHWLVILLDEPIEYLDGSQFYDATKSGLSLLKKHNLNPETTIILKKQ